MTVSLKKTVVSLSVACSARSGRCTSYTEVPIETPIQPKLDVSAFQRIFIAGFIAGESDDVDANMETVRLLRSQLRTKGIMRVIDADTLPLIDVARQEGGDGSEPPAPDNQATNGNQEPPKASRPTSRTKRISSPISASSRNVAYWKRIGEEFQQPLIVTGSVLFAPQARSGFVQREQEVYDSFGRRQVVAVRTYMERKGSSFVRRSSSSTGEPERRSTARRSARKSSTTPTSRPRRSRRFSN